MEKWQHYRTQVNGNNALISVDLRYVEEQKVDAVHIVQFSVPFPAGEDGLPTEETFRKLVKRLLKIGALTEALERVYYVGYWLCQGQMQVYFYTTEQGKLPFLEILHQLDLEKIKVQLDPNWDIYFDFLTPSALEIKMTATEEMLSVLRQNGEMLDRTYLVDHRFYFYEERDMQQFLHYVSEQEQSFLSLQHSAIPVPVENNENAYLVKVEQEVNLEENVIFDTVAFFEQASVDFQGRYLGWKVQDNVVKSKYLN